MPGSKSDFLEAKVLDHVFGGATYTRPSTMYVALYTAAPSDSGGGTEVSGGAYARVAVTNNTTNWTRSGSVVTNGTDITFPTATVDWGTVVAYGIFDNATNGNLLFWATLETNKTIGIGDALRFVAGLGISLSED